MSNFNKDRETKFGRIMCSKWSSLPLNLTPCFLLLIMIKYNRSTMMETKTLLNSNAFVCFIDKELVR
jgi:hypothetical protein